jgi:hypothetical protein
VVSAARDEEVRPAAGEAKDRAWGAVREAQASWAGAVRAPEMAPPDPGFRARLRALSQAAGAMRDTHTRALEAGLAWRPVDGSKTRASAV